MKAYVCKYLIKLFVIYCIFIYTSICHVRYFLNILNSIIDSIDIIFLMYNNESAKLCYI